MPAGWIPKSESKDAKLAPIAEAAEEEVKESCEHAKQQEDQKPEKLSLGFVEPSSVPSHHGIKPIPDLFSNSEARGQQSALPSVAPAGFEQDEAASQL